EVFPLLGSPTRPIFMERHAIFFFSSRRRHTRSYGDWSSDVCSSDLGERTLLVVNRGFADAMRIGNQARPRLFDLAITLPSMLYRSEERRVGKECRSRGSPDR